MNLRNNEVNKLYSQSAILSVGTIFVAVSLFLFKIIFYQKSEPLFYSEFLLAYSIYLFYQIFGFLNVGNPLSNDINKIKDDTENSKTVFIMNAIYLVLIFSLISNILLMINLLLLKINWTIILVFLAVMFFSNVNLVFITFYRGMEKIVLSSILLIIKGILKPIILFSLSYVMTLTATNIALSFLIAEIVAFLVSVIAFTIWYKKNNFSFQKFQFNFSIFKVYFYQGFLLVVISLCIQGFRSILFIILSNQHSEEILGFVDVPITFLAFALAFFNNIGLMLAVKSNQFNTKKKFAKFLFAQIFSISVLIVVIYEIIANFIQLDETVLQFIFDLDGGILARGLMILLPSLPFLVVFYISSGYQQGKRKYYGVTLAAIFSFILSIPPGYFLIKFLLVDGALISLNIFSVLLAIFTVVITFNDKIELKLDNIIDSIKKLFTKNKRSSLNEELL